MGRGRGGAPPQPQWPSGRASVWWPWARRSFGLPQRCLWPRRGFLFRQSRKRGSLSSSVRLIRSLSTFAVETLLALRGAELRSWWGCCTSAKRELDIIAKPWGLLHEALLSGRSLLAPCAQKLAATLCPCNILLATC